MFLVDRVGVFVSFDLALLSLAKHTPVGGIARALGPGQGVSAEKNIKRQKIEKYLLTRDISRDMLCT